MATNLRKFGRDFAVALVGFIATYLGTNAAGLGLPPGVAVAAAPAALFIYRLLREQFGMGPEQPPPA